MNLLGLNELNLLWITSFPSLSFHQITPIHCAAINPNAKYLTRLLGVLPEYNLPDKQNRRPIHYAAACSGTGPLEYLLKR